MWAAPTANPLASEFLHGEASLLVFNIGPVQIYPNSANLQRYYDSRIVRKPISHITMGRRISYVVLKGATTRNAAAGYAARPGV